MPPFCVAAYFGGYVIAINLPTLWRYPFFKAFLVLLRVALHGSNSGCAPYTTCAATSLLIAAKMQEAWNTHPSLKELALAGNNYFKCSDIEVCPAQRSLLWIVVGLQPNNVMPSAG
jgi:hypothetical protein